jgi:hypothetical protein
MRNEEQGGYREQIREPIAAKRLISPRFGSYPAITWRRLDVDTNGHRILATPQRCVVARAGAAVVLVDEQKFV